MKLENFERYLLRSKNEASLVSFWSSRTPRKKKWDAAYDAVDFSRQWREESGWGQGWLCRPRLELTRLDGQNHDPKKTQTRRTFQVIQFAWEKALNTQRPSRIRL